MPEIGEIRQGRGAGYKNQCGNWIWVGCISCGKERWVRLRQGNPISKYCRKCAIKENPRRRGENSSHWKGGRKINKGYIYIRLQPSDFFYPMVKKDGYVAEHRLVVAKALSRCLLSWEVVHHKGKKYPQGSIENKSDNRYPENLELLPTSKYHLVDTVARSLISNLQSRVTILEAENILLKEQIKEQERQRI